MAATDLPGFATIRQWAQYCGVPGIDQSIDRARQIMEAHPEAMAAGRDRLDRLGSELETRRQDIEQSGTNLYSTGWSGAAADAFAPHNAKAGQHVAGAGERARALAAKAGNVSQALGEGQNTVVASTGTTAAYLDMLGVQGG